MLAQVMEEFQSAVQNRMTFSRMFNLYFKDMDSMAGLPGAATLGMVFTYEGELLHQAAIYDQDQFMIDLLSNDGNGTVKSRDPEGRTPLHTAASHGSVKCVKALLERGADPNSISGIEDQCSTPVHHAAKRGHLGCLAALLEYEVNIDLRNSDGMKALELAQRENTNDCKKCVQYMEKVKEKRRRELEIAKCEELYDFIDDGDFYNAQKTFETLDDPYAIVNKYFRGPNTLLYRASFGGHLDIVNMLIKYRADGRPNADSGITPLFAACSAGHFEVALRLIEVFPKHLVIPATVEEYYPIHVAITKGHLGILSRLLQLRNTEKNARKKEQQQQRQAMEELVTTGQRPKNATNLTDDAEEYFVDVNQPVRSGYTALHLAVMHGNIKVVKMLLMCTPILKEAECTSGMACNGLIIDKKANGKTAFHQAVALNKVDVAELLIKNRADVRDPLDLMEPELTPLKHACKNNMEEMVEMLLRNGATDDDNSIRFNALVEGRDNIVQILLNQDVQSSEYPMALAANELNIGLKSVFISWPRKRLELIKEEWILNAGVHFNTRSLSERLRADLGLSLKIFTSIDLSSNFLESLPLILFQMPSLKSLNVSKNKLKFLPLPPTSQATDDSNVGMPNTDKESFSIFTQNWNCPSLETLEVQNNKLKELPTCIFEMPSLTTANFSWNQIEKIPFEMWYAPSLKSMTLENNCLKELPMFASGAKSSATKTRKKERANTTPHKYPDMVDSGPPQKNNEFSTLPQFYSKRPSWNDESDDSDEEEVEVIKKSGLNRLDISDNQLTTIPEGLPCLAPNLNRLIMRKNKINEVVALSCFPEHLGTLDISENCLKQFNVMAGKENCIVNNMCYAVVRKPSIHRTKSYKKRYCQHRKHKQLVDLNRLMLANNSLDSIQMTVQGNDKEKPTILFPELRFLDISSNRLGKVPSGIGKLENLSSLTLSDNTHLDMLPSELGLCSSLYELKIDNLKLKDLPKNVIEKNADGRIDVKRLIGYLKSLHDNAQTYPNIKLMVVGVHGIGKTSLLEQLRKEGSGSYKDQDHPSHFNDRRRSQKLQGSLKGNKSTVGVDVCDWSFGKRQQMVIKFSTWDFAGQTEYYATHQCFLSKRALYLCLWKITDGRSAIDGIEQWLLNIQARAPNCTVIIIGTFLDQAEKMGKGYVENLQKEIKTRFVSNKNGGGVSDLVEKGLPRVAAVMEVSCKSGKNISKLRELIYDTVMDIKSEEKNKKKSLLEVKIPKSYIDVEKAVTKIADDINARGEMPVLDKNTFRKLVNEHLVQNDAVLRNGNDELDQAVRFLHDYGILLHYDDPSLRDLYFVDPQWLCDMLAHVVTVRSVNPFVKNGVLKISDLQNQIFKGEKRFPSSMVMKYVELMSKFEVAIKISEKFLLIPSLLPDRQKECPIVADHDADELRKAMNIHAYLNVCVHRRQYLMSYVPTGFWARLLTRLIADDRIGKIVSSCCEINGSDKQSVEKQKNDMVTLIRAAPPEWACWKTGIELSCFGAKLLRVCQLDDDVSYYGEKASSTGVFVKSQNEDNVKRTPVVIVAPSLTLSIDKFVQKSQDGEDRNLVGFQFVGIKNMSSRASCKLLVITIEHIDNLLTEWYPKIDSCSNIHGVKAIRRISFCNQCIENGIKLSSMSLGLDKTSLNSKDTNANIGDKVVIDSNNNDNDGNDKNTDDTKERQVFTPTNLDDSNIDDLEASVDNINITFDKEGEIVDEKDGAVEKKFNSAADDFSYDSLGLDKEEAELLEHYRAAGDGKIIAFQLEEASKLLRNNKPLLCPFHLEVEPEKVFPDLCFVDLDEKHLITPQQIDKGDRLGSGAYGDVYAAKLTLNTGVGKKLVYAAMKIPVDSQKDKAKPSMETMFSYDTYKTIRQEVAILVALDHVNIVTFFGVSRTPFSMVLELAPMGALDDRYKDYQRVGKKLNAYVIQKSLQQISSALKYLHRHHIIYRDLKCENVLCWAFPSPSVADPENHQVLLKITDYGISRSVSLGGIKGFLGTPGYMAPEILRYTGKESYSVKVDCFSFGSLMYELIALKHPYEDLMNDKARLSQHYIQNGKRPKLTSREKRSPILLLSLLYRCWAQNPEDRPSAAEIHGLTSLPEFPKLMDSLGLGENFNLQCVTTTNQSRADCSVVDSRSVVGSHLWFCGYQGIGPAVSARKEGLITVFSYHDGRYTHTTNFKVHDRVFQVCPVGSSVWLGTESGLIQVFCALTYKPVAVGYCNYRYILKILHSPICNTVLVSLSDGNVYVYDDNISKYTETITQKDVTELFFTSDRNIIVKKLTHRGQFVGGDKIHCMVGISSFYEVNQHKTAKEKNIRKETKDDGNLTSNTPLSTTPTTNSNTTSSTPRKNSNNSQQQKYELWCGQDKGRITVLDMKTLHVKITLPFTGDDLTNPVLKDLKIQFLEISRSFSNSAVQNTDADNETNYIDLSQYIWTVAYPGTKVVRWNVNNRKIEDKFDASYHSPWHDLNSVKVSKKTKALRPPDAQIYSLSVVERTMYIGTTFGCLIVCDAINMVPTLSLRCYDEFVDNIIPLRMISSRSREDQTKKLVLTIGRKCLDFWVRNFDRKKRIVSKEMTILTWEN